MIGQKTGGLDYAQLYVGFYYNRVGGTEWTVVVEVSLYLRSVYVFFMLLVFIDSG
jgi:hypothetical protein